MQGFLFGHADPSVDGSFSQVRRIELNNTAWVERVPEWLAGHSVLFERLRDEVDWKRQQREMYERVVDVPRLLGALKSGTGSQALLQRIAEMLGHRYSKDLSAISLAYYRNGLDSVAMHGDKLGPSVDDAVVAVLSLGFPRRFLMRPKAQPGARSLSFTCGCGDLLVMGGSCQRDFEHGVPKTAHADGRISVMFRQPSPRGLSEALEAGLAGADHQRHFGKPSPGKSPRSAA